MEYKNTQFADLKEEFSEYKNTQFAELKEEFSEYKNTQYSYTLTPEVLVAVNSITPSEVFEEGVMVSFELSVFENVAVMTADYRVELNTNNIDSGSVTTPYAGSVSIANTDLNLGNNTLEIFIDNESKFTYDIIKYEDDLILKRRFHYNTEHELTGAILDPGNGITLDGVGSGEAVINLNTNKKYGVDNISMTTLNETEPTVQSFTKSMNSEGNIL